MAFNAGTITAELELNGQDFIATLKNADDVLEAFGASAREAAENSGGLFQSFIDFKGAFDLMVDGFNLVKDALGGVVDFFGKAIEASDEFEANVQSLDVALRLRNLGSMKDDLVGLGIELEGATKFSRNTAIEVERLLTVFGVRSQDIPGFTEAVLNLSHAMGIDTVAAARLLGRSLSGSVGRLSQYIPEAKGLSDAALKMGGAFQLVNDKLGGFARAASNTSEAIEERFFNSITAALQSFGDTISPILDTFFVAGREILNALSEGITSNASDIQEFFAGIAQYGVTALQAIVDFLIDMPVHIAKVQSFFANLRLEIVGGFTEAKITALDFLATLQAKFAEFASSYGGKLFGFDSDDAAAANAALEQTQNALSGARAQADLLATGLAASRANGEQLVAAAQASADAIRNGADQSSTWSKFIHSVQGSLADADKTLQGMVDHADQVDHSFDGIRASTGDWLRHLREVNGITLDAREAVADLHSSYGAASKAAKETAKAVHGAADETDRAASSADRVASSFSNAAASARQAADAISETAGGFGQFGGSSVTAGMGGFHQGGSLGLDLSNANATAAALDQLNRAKPYAYKFQETAAANVRNKVAGILRQQMQEEISGFIGAITDDLTRQGIFDPAQRNSMIAQRFDEARRLGTLPRGATFNSSTGTVGGYG